MYYIDLWILEKHYQLIFQTETGFLAMVSRNVASSPIKRTAVEVGVCVKLHGSCIED